MIELKGKNTLRFSFPEVHPEAILDINFQRTLRIPDDGKEYPLPPGLGRFAMEHTDDHAAKVPESWRRRGGVMLPMYQSEALWIHFDSHYIHNRDCNYPFAVKIAAGKINAVTGERWSSALHADPKQDYVAIPRQPWLDGFVVKENLIRQFVAMPLGAGYTAEEQLTGEAEHGGLQIIVYPMGGKTFNRKFPVCIKKRRGIWRNSFETLECASAAALGAVSEMGLAPGGMMRQTIYQDDQELSDYASESSRCFVHLANSMVWQAITGKRPPHPPRTAKDYSDAGLPWFDYYADGKAVKGSEKLAGLKSVLQIGKEKQEIPLPENEGAAPKQLVTIDQRNRSKNQVREFED